MCTAAGRPATELSQKKRLTTANPRAAAGAEPAGLAAGERAALEFRRGTSQARSIKTRFCLGWAPPPPPGPGRPGPWTHSGCQRSPSRPRDPPHLTGKEPWVPDPALSRARDSPHPTGERPPSAPPTPRRPLPSAETHLTGKRLSGAPLSLPEHRAGDSDSPNPLSTSRHCPDPSLMPDRERRGPAPSPPAVTALPVETGPAPARRFPPPEGAGGREASGPAGREGTHLRGGDTPEGGGGHT